MKRIECPRCCSDADEVMRSDLLNQRTIDCPNCGRITRQLVDRKAEARAERRRNRARHEYNRWVEKVSDRPRTRLHKPLKVTPEIRRAWSDVRKARRADSLVRRGQVFVDLMIAAARDEARHPDAWRTTLKLKNGELTKHRSRGGSAGTPTVVLKPLGRATLGMFRRSVLNSVYEIQLDPAQHDPDDRLTDLRRTLLHELQHALDAETQIPDGGHGRLWKIRLGRLEAMFPVSQFGTRNQ